MSRLFQFHLPEGVLTRTMHTRIDFRKKAAQFRARFKNRFVGYSFFGLATFQKSTVLTVSVCLPVMDSRIQVSFLMYLIIRREVFVTKVISLPILKILNLATSYVIIAFQMKTIPSSGVQWGLNNRNSWHRTRKSAARKKMRKGNYFLQAKACGAVSLKCDDDRICGSNPQQIILHTTVSVIEL